MRYLRWMMDMRSKQPAKAIILQRWFRRRKQAKVAQKIIRMAALLEYKVHTCSQFACDGLYACAYICVCVYVCSAESMTGIACALKIVVVKACAKFGTNQSSSNAFGAAA
jgi:hypothetical protein